VGFSIASATGKSLAGEVRESAPICMVTVSQGGRRYTVDCLIGCSADVTGVVSVRPLRVVHETCV